MNPDPLRPTEPRQLINAIFGDYVLIPADVRKEAPLLAQYIVLVTPAVAPKRAAEGVPTVGEELVHLLSTIESYLEDCCPGCMTKREWGRLIIDGKAYEGFETLRREAEAVVHRMQLDRELRYPWIGKRVTVRDVLWHLADHTAHHRGRLALLLRLCGVEPPAL